MKNAEPRLFANRTDRNLASPLGTFPIAMFGTDQIATIARWRRAPYQIGLGGLVLLALLAATYRRPDAQTVPDAAANERIEAIRIIITNPSAAAAINSRIEDEVRRALGIFPSDRYQKTGVDIVLSTLKRDPQIEDVTHSITFGPTGGVVLNVRVTLNESATTARPRGILTKGGKRDFPVLYDQHGTHARLKLEGLAMYYGNNDAWYSQPDTMLAGNPLIQGKPAGAGYTNWLEGYIQLGVYGITSITRTVYTYAGISAIAGSQCPRR